MALKKSASKKPLSASEVESAVKRARELDNEIAELDGKIAAEEDQINEIEAGAIERFGTADVDLLDKKHVDIDTEMIHLAEEIIELVK